MKTIYKILTLILCVCLCIGAAAVAPVFADAVKYGDVNGDTYINAKDTLLLRRYISRQKVTIDTLAADCEYDGSINAKDTLLLRKYIARWKGITLGPDIVKTTVPTTIPTTIAPTTTVPTTTMPTTAALTTLPSYTSTTYTAADLVKGGNFVGRAVENNGDIVMSMTASGIEFCANMMGDVSICAKWSGASGPLGVIVDGDFENMTITKIQNNSTYRSFSLGLSIAAGKHTVKIVKLNEDMSNLCRIKSVTFNGALAEKPAKRPLKIEFYGDSITCGYGNLSKSTTNPYSDSKPFEDLENGYYTYAGFVSEALGADFSVCAHAGWGILSNYAGDKNGVLYNILDKAAYNKERISFPDDRFDADIVVINLGTNDTGYARTRYVSTGYDDFKAGCMKIINFIRGRNPDCKIVWISGMMGSYTNQYIDLEKVLTDLEKEVKDFHFKGGFYTKQSGGGNHPNVSEHREVAKSLEAYLRDELKIGK